MNRVGPRYLCLLVFCLIPVFSYAERFRSAEPGYRFIFPRDHGPHEDFRTEWWYFTGQVADRDGRRFGYQLTFFRTGMAEDAPHRNPSAWAIRHLYLAHFAITDVGGGRFRYADRIARPGPGLAGVEPACPAGRPKAGNKAEGTNRVWIDRWSAAREGDTHHLRAADREIALDLRLQESRRPVIHGRNGLSRKGEGPGAASHYYSLTRLATRGSLTVAGRTFEVSGLSWMDHEFMTNELGPDQVGWDWFSIQLDDGYDLMVYRLRRSDGTIEPASSGTLVLPNGGTIHLPRDAVRPEVLERWKSPRSGAVYPVGWRLQIPAHGIDVTVIPRLNDQELVTTRSTGVTYWEGAIRVEGTRRGRAVAGEGYLELTGYAHPMKNAF